MKGYVLALLVLAVLLGSIATVLLNLQTYPLVTMAGLISGGLTAVALLEALLAWRDFRK